MNKLKGVMPVLALILSVLTAVLTVAFAAGMKSQTVEYVNNRIGVIEARQGATEDAMKSLSGDVREIKTDVKWLVRGKGGAP